MANANINLVQLANTFNDWRIITNNEANSINELRNGNYYKDGGNFTLANGALFITSTSGTGLSVTNNVIFSALATLNTSIHTGSASFFDNVSAVGVNSWIGFANVITGPMMIANSKMYSNGGLHVSGANLSNSPFITSIAGNVTVNVANNIFMSNTGNMEIKGNVLHSNASSLLNVAGNLQVSANANVSVLKVTTNAEIDVLFLDPSHTFQIVNGNAIFANVQINGTQTLVGNITFGSDTLLIRYGVATSGDGKLVVEQGTTNGNAVLRFSQNSNTWQTTANDLTTFKTIITTANLIDSVSNTSLNNAPTANALNWSYLTAIAAYNQANTAYNTANAGSAAATAYAQANAAFSQANAAYTQANAAYALANTGGAGAAAASATANAAYGVANVANTLAQGALQRSGGTMTGSITMTPGTELITPIFVGYGEVITSAVATVAQVANLSLANFFDYTLEAPNTAISFASAIAAGNAQAFTMILRQPSTAANVINFPANTIKWSNGEVPVLSSGIANKLDILTFVTVDGGVTFYGAHSMANVG